NAVGLNNGFKPRLANIHQYLPGVLDWAQANDLPMRGHLLMWPGIGDLADLDDPTAVIGVDYGTHLSQEWMSDYKSYNVRAAVETYKESARTQADKDALEAVVDAEIQEWAGNWEVYEWDVINETLGNHLLQDILGDDQMAEWFKIAESNVVSPDCKLLINDYQIISSMSEARKAGWYTDRRDRYMTNINQVIADGGRLDRIGFQSRIKLERHDPQIFYDRLEEWGNAYGLEMVGTEFEVVNSNPGDWMEYIYTDEERAQITEEMMTQYYSHPLVTGLNAWNTINDDIEALVDYSGHPTRNGLVWYYLHRIRYMTDTNDTTDAAGTVSARAFKGDYDITVSYGGNDYPATLTLASNQTAIIMLEDVTQGPGSSNRLIEDWQMNDADGTGIGGLVNSAGSGAWSGDLPNVVTASGNLRFTQGDNNYRNSSLTEANVVSGLYELAFKYSAVTMAGGDATGATVGFGLRDEGAGSDLFLVRILRQNNKLLLQTRIGTTNTTIHDFGGGVSSLPDTVGIRAVVDLDTDLMDLYYEIGTGGETLVADIAITDGEMDQVRMVGVLNAVDFGATDFVDIDYVSLRSLNWISADGLYDEWVALYPGIGSSTNLTDNPDGDPLSNLAEYALGGDPANGSDVGYVPANTMLELGGTNYFEYVYAKRNDAADRGLIYSLELTDDLLSDSWTNGNVEVVGTGTLDTEFDSVTNRVPTVGEDQGFIRLWIEYQ
ncbi:MAG: endo-1,4-beta-xylanase, partial [Verrucomicrobia bacterium]|nr:endo-1,4-beta-xylanase [Verrucomicrobiota bacterium]